MSNGLGVIERTGALFQQRQIVQRIYDVLLPVVAPWMRDDHLIPVQDVDPQRIGLDYQVALGPARGHRIAVGVKRHLTEAIKRYRFVGTTL